MGALEDGLAYLSQNIGYIVTIIGSVALGVKYVIAEVNKRADRLDKKIMGPEGNAREGKGGAIDDLRTEYKRDLRALEDRMEGKITQSTKDLLYEYRQTSQKINYVVMNMGRMERSLEKVTDGKYTAARLETNREEGYNDSDNVDPQTDGSTDTYNKRRRRNL